ncbi:MAG: hypothetical protein KAH72_00895 [Flavobacteriaceae bacterium]|nr:hypothetical protein [Flavobacteriaceae bacterium]
MKSKRNIYVLLSAVILLWGFIGYRIFASISSSKKTNTVIAKIEKFQPKNTTAKEAYVIQANYRDPFLGTIVKSKKKTISIPKQKKEKVVFPTIEYKGVFSSSLKKNTVYLIVIKGKQEIFKIKEVHQEVKLLQGNKEKIIVKYQKEKQTFYLKK